jgi:chromosome segregation ATPase
VEHNIAGLAAGTEVPAGIKEHVEATMLSIWRRVLSEGGPDLTLGEAANLLESSVDVVRDQIKAGQVHSSHDEHGHIRITAGITYTLEGAIESETADSDSIARLWSEIRALQEDLDASRAEESRLTAELNAAERALDYTKAEVANLWRVMTNRNLRQAARKAVEESREGARVLDLAEQRRRIRGKVADVRELARRRKWPWSLVG